MKWTPPLLLQVFLAGLAWAWQHERDFLLAFGALGVSAIGLGLWAPNPYQVAGGIAVLVALVCACLVYGSHVR